MVGYMPCCKPTNHVANCPCLRFTSQPQGELNQSQESLKMQLSHLDEASVEQNTVECEGYHWGIS